ILSSGSHRSQDQGTNRNLRTAREIARAGLVGNSLERLSTLPDVRKQLSSFPGIKLDPNDRCCTSQYGIEIRTELLSSRQQHLIGRHPDVFETVSIRHDHV